MTNRVRGCWSAVLRWLSGRPPRGHMEMLRGVVSRRDDERVAHAAASAEKRQTHDEDAIAARGDDEDPSGKP